MTDLEAIAKAQRELDISNYYEETSCYAGMRAIHRNRAEWLVRVISLARGTLYIGENQKQPQTNADRIRAMSDEQLARFLSDRFTKESCHRLYGEGRMLTATEIAAIGHTWYCSWMQWLKQPAEDE